jgi:glycosyltransferase involved in cell wall biosynthesis
MKIRLVHSAPDGSVASGGDLYDSRLCAALRALGHDAHVAPEPEAGAVHLFDGLHAARWAPLVRTLPGLKVALVHQPLANVGLDASAEAAFFAGCDALQFVSVRAETETRARYPVLPPSWVAVPGIDHFTPLPSARERRLVSIGHVIPGKGPLEALELVAALPGEWHLDWLGALDVDEAFARTVLARRNALGLARRVTFHGRVDVAPFLARASACLTTSRGESWGLGLAEALRAGVPVVGTTPAGVLDFVGGAGSRTAPGLSEPGEDRPHEQMHTWLTRLLDDASHPLRAEAKAAGALLPSWSECAATTARALETLCAR